MIVRVVVTEISETKTEQEHSLVSKDQEKEVTPTEVTPTKVNATNGPRKANAQTENHALLNMTLIREVNAEGDLVTEHTKTRKQNDLKGLPLHDPLMDLNPEEDLNPKETTTGRNEVNHHLAKITSHYAKIS